MLEPSGPRPDFSLTGLTMSRGPACFRWFSLMLRSVASSGIRLRQLSSESERGEERIKLMASMADSIWKQVLQEVILDPGLAGVGRQGWEERKGKGPQGGGMAL